MAVAIDLPDDISPWTGIHPRYKTDIAKRLVLGAMDIAYGQTTVWTGPIFSSWNVTKIEKNQLQLHIIFKEESVQATLGLEIRDKKGFEVSVFQNCTFLNDVQYCNKMFASFFILHIK